MKKQKTTIERKVNSIVENVLDFDLKAGDLEEFRHTVMKAKIGMEHTRDIVMTERINQAQLIRVVTLVSEDVSAKKKSLRKLLPNLNI